MKRKPFIIAVDFDGTCVTHEYPRIGKDIGAVDWLQRWSKHAHIILYTMRDGAELADAKEWFSKHNIELYGANFNPNTWSASPKVYAHIYVDDAAFGCPLINTPTRPYVDWSVVGPGVMKILTGEV